MRMRFLVVLFSLLTCTLYGQQAAPDTTAPIVPKPQTATVFTTGLLATAPFRGVNAAVALVPGVVQIDGNLHMRGGRSDEIGFYVDGLNVSRPMGGTNSLPLIHNAIESVTVYTGGAPAHLGGHLSGAVETRLKTGGDKLKLTGEIISDDFWAVKDSRGAYEILGIDELYSFGYNDYVLTLGGPVPKTGGRLKFFIAGQSWNRASEATRYAGFHQDSLQLTKTWYDRDVNPVTDTLDLYIDSPPGRIPGKRDGGWRFNGNLSYSHERLSARLGLGAAFTRRRSSTTDPAEWLDVTGGRRPYYRDESNQFAVLNATYRAGGEMEVGFRAGLWHRFYESYDSQWGDDLMKYGDPDLNSGLLDASLTRHYQLPFDDHWSVLHPGTPHRDYVKDDERRLQLGVDLSKAWGPRHTLALGVTYSRETLRRYAINALGVYDRLEQWLDPATGDPRPDCTVYDVYGALLPRMIGYDWLGNAVDEDVHVTTLQWVDEEIPVNLHNKPMIPQHFSAYAEYRLLMDGLAMTAGLRLDHFRNGWWSIKDWKNLHRMPGLILDDELDIGKERSHDYLTPHLSFSFLATETTTFFAHYDQWVQAPDPLETWAAKGYTRFCREILRAGYFTPFPNPNLKPIKNWQAEMGAVLSLGQSVDLEMSAFYRSLWDLGHYGVILPEATSYRAPTVANSGAEGTVMGTAFSLRARGLSLSYTLQKAISGFLPYSRTHDIYWSVTERSPFVVLPEDHDIRHTVKGFWSASTGAEQGPQCFGHYPLARLNLALQLNGQSGRPYTRIAIKNSYSEVYGYNAPKPLGQVNGARLGWWWQLDIKLGKSFDVGPVRAEVYLWALNLLNSKAAVNGFRQTGQPDSDGWLLTAEGQQKIRDRGQDWRNWYNADLTDCGSFGWQPPRQLRLGVRFEI